MTTIREQILTQLVNTTLHFTTSGGPVPQTYRTRKAGVIKGETPVIIVSPVSESVERYSHLNDRRDLEVDIALVTRGDPWDAIADPWAQSIHGAILTDPALIALVASIRATESTWTDEEADRTAGVLSMRFRFTYLSSASSLYLPPR